MPCRGLPQVISVPKKQILLVICWVLALSFEFFKFVDMVINVRVPGWRHILQHWRVCDWRIIIELYNVFVVISVLLSKHKLINPCVDLPLLLCFHTCIEPGFKLLHTVAPKYFCSSTACNIFPFEYIRSWCIVLFPVLCICYAIVVQLWNEKPPCTSLFGQ